MIVTVLPNPALDKTVIIPGFTVGRTYREKVLTLAGGKGFNFARALHTLGQRNTVITHFGGYAGQHLRALARRDGLECEGITIEAELRTCLTIVDPQANYRLSEVYELGEVLTEDIWRRLLALAVSHFAGARFLALCGSFPPGLPLTGLHDLLLHAREAGLPALLDTYGPPLPLALELRPALLKVNQHEASSLLGREITTAQQALVAAQELKQRGAREVVITLGSQGAIGLTEQGKSFGWSSPHVQAVSAIGSGDSLFAGIATGLERGLSLTEATRLGVATGAANTLQIGAGRFDLQQVEELLPKVQPLAI